MDVALYQINNNNIIIIINVHLQSMKRRGTFDWIQC